MNDDVPFEDYVTYPDDKRPYSRDVKCPTCNKGFKRQADLNNHSLETGHAGSNRLPCVVPHCNRTRKPDPLPEWICGKHWKLTDRTTRRNYFKSRRRGRYELAAKLWSKLKQQAIERGMGI